MDQKNVARELLDETTLMSGEIEIADHKRHLKRYKACFTGRQAVQWMIASRVAADLPEALAFGAALVKAELVKAGGGHLLFTPTTITTCLHSSVLTAPFTTNEKPPRVSMSRASS